MAERVATGISGLDKMLYGGIPAESQVLLTGGPGAGKSLLSFEYLYRNAKAGNTSIFFAFEEDPEEIIENAKAAFPELADIDDMIGSGKLIIDREAPTGELISATNKDEDLFQFGSIMTKIENRINETKATRVVIDSISILGIMIKDVGTYRKYMLALITNLKRLGVTSIMTMEMENPDRSKLAFKPEHFIFDGIVALYQSGESTKRMLTAEILKIRGTRHSFTTAPYDITPKGFRIFAAEDIAPD